MSIAILRQKYHHRIRQEIVRFKKSKKYGLYPNFADVGNRASVLTARYILELMGHALDPTEETENISGQTAGSRFEAITCDFLQKSFDLLAHVRPGSWLFRAQTTQIAHFAQYAHLATLEQLVRDSEDLKSALGGNYIVKPDIVVGRYPLDDPMLNQLGAGLERQLQIADLTPLRKRNNPCNPLLHASISCKWTVRSDRAQNTQTEALNLIRNRKGSLPHIVAVTGEPLPTRLASIALGTGDLDCVYHFALPELQIALKQLGNEDQMDMLQVLVTGHRLRDISDLPFDLAA